MSVTATTVSKSSIAGPYLAPDFMAEPYWWRVARPRFIGLHPLAAAYDVVVIGAGYTGLRAALELARGGAKVLVCERETAGFGASRRNAGYLGRTLKRSFPELVEIGGYEYAQRVFSEMNAAFRGTLDFVEKEAIECHAVQNGRFIAATSAPHLEQMVSDYDALQQAMKFPFSVVDKANVGQEMGSPNYHGGIVVPDLGAIHPALYHEGLLKLSLDAGVTVATGTPVESFERTGGDRFDVSTTRGKLKADRIIMATNGYTPTRQSWFARRVIPFTGYMAATEELDPQLLSELIPRDRTIIDSNTNIDFFRSAPDSKRLLFGASAGSALADTQAIARRLACVLYRVYPQLKGTRLSAVWSGQCAATFDMMPHMGSRDGVWYALGYNFAGVPMSTYLGNRMAQEILGRSSEPSAFAQTPFKSFPLYTGNPWFVPLAMKVFDWQDRRLARRKAH